MRVLVFGTFDRLHPGHLNFFQQAKALGDELYCVVARDQTVGHHKGHTPVQDEQARLTNVQGVSAVTHAELGDLVDPYSVIPKLNPQIIALGYDQNIFTEQLEGKLKEMSLSIPVIRLQPYHPEKFKSSKITSDT